MMAIGVFKDNAGWVQVSYDGKYAMSMKRSDYEDRDYKPRYESLPSRQQYEKSKHPKDPKGQRRNAE